MSQTRPQRNTRFNSGRGSGFGGNWHQGQRQQQQPKQRYDNSQPPEFRSVIGNVGIKFLPASQQQQPPMPAPPQPPQMSYGNQESEMESSENGFQAEGGEYKKNWKGQGVSKLTVGEKRRRKNKQLSRALVPKSALMVVNELNKGESNFTVEQVSNNADFGDSRTGQYVATLSAGGSEYKGFAVSKGLAKNDAAEQAIRGWMFKRMEKLSKGNDDDVVMDATDGNGEEDEEDISMLSVASFALHKLFSEWQADGFKMPISNKIPPPQPNPAKAGSNAPPKTPKKRVLPENAGRLHPSMLLCQMHPGIEYLDLPSEGEKPNLIFVLSVTVEGSTYVGKGATKKEARKVAARQACEEIHGVVFEDNTN